MSDVFLRDDAAVAAALCDAGLDRDVEAAPSLCGACLRGSKLVSGPVLPRHLKVWGDPCDLTAQQRPVIRLMNDLEVRLQSCACKYVDRNKFMKVTRPQNAPGLNLSYTGLRTSI